MYVYVYMYLCFCLWGDSVCVSFFNILTTRGLIVKKKVFVRKRKAVMDITG